MPFVGPHEMEKVANAARGNLLGDEDKCIVTQEIHDNKKNRKDFVFLRKEV